MDNICHTLVGAACGEAGLKRRTRYGNAALMISANLPDVDVLVFATNTLPVSFRRGWTHGIAAQILLPIALTVILVLIARLSRTQDGAAPVRAGWLLALSYIGVSSHVLLDLLNNYGVRLLAPLDWRWFYGDAVFIIDPWLWLALGAGVWLARRQRAAAPARGSLVFAACYVVLMLMSARAAREHVLDAWRVERGTEPRALMVGPAAVTPLTKEIIVDAGDHYETGVFTWWPTAVAFLPGEVPKNAQRPEVGAAARTSQEVAAFLVWSRFPFWTLAPSGHETRVTVQDMRFRLGGARFAASAVVPAQSTASD